MRAHFNCCYGSWRQAACPQMPLGFNERFRRACDGTEQEETGVGAYSAAYLAAAWVRNDLKDASPGRC